MKNRNYLAFLFLATLALQSCGGSKEIGLAESGLEQYARLARGAAAETTGSQGSLWSDRSYYADSFRDVKAWRVSDLVTIEVLESTSAISEAKTATSRESSMTGAAPNLFGLEKSVAELPGLVDTSSEREFSGDGSTERSSVLRTSITASVLEVFPNGNLMIEGAREVVINGERQMVTVRGVARPNDISAGNVIVSTRIAQMELAVNGKGIVTEAQKPGVLYKILSGFWPF